MQDSIYYLIDKNYIRRNILNRIELCPLNINSVIDARMEFFGLGYDLLSVVEKLNINYLYVNNLEEGLKIRKINSNIKIIIKNIDKDYIYDAIVNNFIITVYSNKELEEIASLNLKDDINIMLYLDCGLNIEGITNLSKSLKIIGESNHINLVGAYSTIYSYYKNFEMLINKFDDLTFCLKKDLLKFLVSDKQIDCNVNFFGKNMYINKNGFNCVTLISKLNQVKHLEKGDLIFNKKVKKDSYYGIINVPYKLDVKYVYIRNEFYKVVFSNDENLIVLLDKGVRVNSSVELLGGNSHNDINNDMLYKEIPKYYVENTDTFRAKY